MTGFITVTLSSDQWQDISSLLDRGHDDLSEYLGDYAEQDGYSSDDLTEMYRLSDGVASDQLMQQVAAAEKGCPWTEGDAAAASREGWNLFKAEGSQLTPAFWDIEREDDQEPSVFDDDESALKHVYEQARAGSDLHRRALALFMTIADAPREGAA